MFATGVAIAGSIHVYNSDSKVHTIELNCSGSKMCAQAQSQRGDISTSQRTSAPVAEGPPTRSAPRRSRVTTDLLNIGAS